jgi:hypothetical protein
VSRHSLTGRWVGSEPKTREKQSFLFMQPLGFLARTREDLSESPSAMAFCHLSGEGRYGFGSGAGRETILFSCHARA